jgi:hypothetical protein
MDSRRAPHAATADLACSVEIRPSDTRRNARIVARVALVPALGLAAVPLPTLPLTAAAPPTSQTIASAAGSGHDCASDAASSPPPASLPAPAPAPSLP